MSRITFFVEKIPPRAEALYRIRQATGQSYAEIQRRIRSGVALVECVLFMNDHEEVAERLRRLVAALSKVGADFRIFETAHDVAVPAIPSPIDEIDADALESILSSFGAEEGGDCLRLRDERDPYLR
jgi:hypothetical protein